MTPKDAGQQFLAELLAQIPEDRRAAVQETLSASEAALNTLGAATLRQSEFSRRMDEADQIVAQTTAYKGELDAWYAANKAKVEAAERTPTTPITTPTTPTTGWTKEDYEADIAQREATYAGAAVAVPDLMFDHFQAFNEKLNVAALMKDPEMRTLGLAGVYQKVYGPKLAEKAKAAEEARINTEVEKRTAERMAATRSMPYPVNGREPHFLDALDPSIKKPADATAPQTPDVVDAAVA
jgi:hypothetical protein